MPFPHTNHTENIPHHPYHTFQNKKREVGGEDHRCTPRFYLSSKRESHMWLIKKEEKEKKTEVGGGVAAILFLDAQQRCISPDPMPAWLSLEEFLTSALPLMVAIATWVPIWMGWGGGVVGCCRMESRKLICTCDESESGFNCWRVKLKWNESCSKHEEYQGKGGQKNGLGRLILVNHLHHCQGYIQIISSHARK